MSASQNCTCCGCVLEDGYTSVISGEGSAEDPLFVEIIDPDFVDERYAIRRERSTDQSILNDTLTAVNFTTAAAGSFDQGGFFSGANPTRFTFPVSGVYILGANSSWASNATGDRDLEIFKNGLIVVEKDENNPTIYTEHLSLATTAPFNAGDYVEVRVRQTSGGALLLQHTTGMSPVFWAIYVGRFV